MKCSRREFVLAGATAIATVGGLCKFSLNSERERAETFLISVFGEDLENNEVLNQFLDDFLQHSGGVQALMNTSSIHLFNNSPADSFRRLTAQEQYLFDKFVRSSTIIAHKEMQMPLKYLGYFLDQYRAPCVSSLSDKILSITSHPHEL